MSQDKNIENKESKVSSSQIDNPANKAMYENALRILQENKYSSEDASKLLEQRPNLILLLSVVAEFDILCVKNQFHFIRERQLQNYLQALQDKSNEQLGAVGANLEKFSGKKRDQWWVFYKGSPIWQCYFHTYLLDIALSLDSLPKEVSNSIHSHGVLGDKEAKDLKEIIDAYKQNMLTSRQLQLLLQSFSSESLGHYYRILKSFDQGRHVELAFELYFLLEDKNKILLAEMLKVIPNRYDSDSVEAVEDFLERFKARPNLISLVYGINYLKIEGGLNLSLSSFLKSVEHRSNDELGVMLSCFERFKEQSISQDFFTALVSMNGLNLPEVKAFLDSLPSTADEKLYKQAIDFVQAGIKYVNEKLLGTTRLAKFLEPIPKDCKDICAFIESRRNLFVADLWMSARMFYYKGEKPKQVPQKDMAEYIAPFIRPDSSDSEVAGGGQGQDLEGVRRSGLE